MSAQADPCILVIFGASGDLTHCKLIPALYEISHSCGTGMPRPERFAVLGVSRTPMTDQQFRDTMRESAQKFAIGFDRAAWDKFAGNLYYHAGDGARLDAYP